MQVGRTRRTSTPKNGVVGGSVLDRRMKIDEGKSGAKVMNREDNSENSGGSVSFRAYGRSRRIQNATDVINRSPIQTRKDNKPMQLRKTKSDIHASESEKKPMHIRKTKSALDKRVGEEEASVSGEIFEKNRSETPSTRSDSYNCNELGVCIEKLNSNSLRTEEQIEIERVVVHDEGADADEEDEGEEEDEEEVEEIEMEIEEQSFDVKEVDIQQVEHKKVEMNEENNKIDLIHVEKPPLISSNVIRPSPQVSYYARINPESTKAPPVWDEFERLQETQSKLQNIVDLVMWKDVSKSAFVFGLGSFFLLSSSFTKDLNFSMISAVSYVGLFYLAATFFYKSILCRGSIDVDEESNQRYLVGEEEAIWLLHLILPYFNGFLLKFKGLFSGDPATTLKLAVTLFILARCGGSITVWKMAKLGFFAVFTVPKVCSSYSTQLTAYGNFWIRRFCDAWNSCKHKKAVAAAIFTLVWNLSSVSARVWAAFMLVVAIRYYQQSLSMLREDWEEEQARGGETRFGRDNIHRHHSGPNLKETIKEKKGS